MATDSDTDSVNDVPVLLRIVKGNKRKRIIDSDDEDESREDTTSEGHSDEGNTSSDGNQGSDDQDDQSSDKGEKVDKSSKGKNGEKKVIDQLSAFIIGYMFYRYRCSDLFLLQTLLYAHLLSSLLLRVPFTALENL